MDILNCRSGRKAQRRLLLVLVALGIGSGAISPPFLLPEEGVTMDAPKLWTWEEITRPTWPDSISRKEALADLTRFQEIIEQAYCGYEFFAKHGHDWRKAFAELRTAVEGREKWTPNEFAHLLADALHFTGDRHFIFFFGTAKGQETIVVGRHISPYFADVLVVRLEDGRLKLIPSEVEELGRGEWFLQACKGKPPNRFLFRTFAPQVGHHAYLLGALSAEPVKQLAVRVRSKDSKQREIKLPLHRGRMAGYQPDYSSAFTFRRETFPILQVTTFNIRVGSPKVQAQLKEFLASASWSEVRESRYVLVDLRGNGGGQEMACNPWLAAFTNEPMRTPMVERLRSPIVYEALLNTELFCHVRSGQATKESFEALRAALLRGEVPEVQEYAVDRRQWNRWESKVLPSTASLCFAGTLFILYDGGTGSQAEDFISMVRQLEHTVLLGENSAGELGFGDCFMYFLPHSKVAFQCGHKLFWDERGEMHEGIGYFPDYWFDATDPLEIILQHAHLLRPHGKS